MMTIRRLTASVLTLLVCLWQTPAFAAPAHNTSQANTTRTNLPGNLNLDLGATTKTVSAGSLVKSGTVNINVNGVVQSISPSSFITPSEQMAVYQMLNTGRQSLNLGSNGQAVSGKLFLTSSLMGSVTNLVVPAKVMVVDNFAGSSALNIGGDLTNAGRFLGLSSSSQTTSAAINAANIFNQAGGVFLTSGGLSLSLNALNNIVNHGSITSSGNLSLAAGGSITNSAASGASRALMQAAGSVNLYSSAINNAGLISALAGNVNVSTAQLQNLALNNTNGTIQALAGNINFNDQLYKGNAGINLSGGDWQAQQINVWADQGALQADVGNVVGTVNIDAGDAHINSAAPNLVLGSMNITGDPVIFQTGNLTLSNNITASESVAILAGGSITSTSTFTSINTSDPSGNGHDVLIISGAKITHSGGNYIVALTGGAGGDINFTASPTLNITTVATNDISAGGKIELIAFANGATGGHVLLNSNSVLDSSSTGSNAGQIRVIAGATTGGDTITLGSVISGSGLNGNNYGKWIYIATSQPTTFDGHPATFNSTGDWTSSDAPWIASPTLQAGNVVVGGNLISKGGNWTVSDPSKWPDQTNFGGLIQVFSGGAVTVVGNIDASGGVITDTFTPPPPDANAPGISLPNGTAGGVVYIQAVKSITIGGFVHANGTNSSGVAGAGGPGQDGESFDEGSGGGQGGYGGRGGSITILSSKGNIAISGDVSANGGNGTNGAAGGKGGIGADGFDGQASQDDANGSTGGTQDGGNGGSGGGGGNGGTIDIEAWGKLTIAGGSVSANGGNGADGAGGGSGGVGGKGGDGADIDNPPDGFAGDGGDGGDGGKGGDGGDGGDAGNGGPITLSTLTGSVNISQSAGARGLGALGGGGGGFGLGGQGGEGFDGAHDGSPGSQGTHGDSGNTVAVNGSDGTAGVFTPKAGGNPVGITSLDLTDPSTIQTIVADQQSSLLGGKLIVSSGKVTGGNLILGPSDIADLSAMDIPANVVVSFSGFSLLNEVKVDLTGSSTTQQAIVNGTTSFTGTGAAGVVQINSTLGGTVLTIGSTGLLSTTGTLAVTAHGDMVISGHATGNVSFITDTGSDGNITVSGTVGTAATAQLTFSLDGAGVFTQASGVLTAKSLVFANTTGNFGSTLTPVKTATNNLTVTTLAGDAYITNSLPLGLNASSVSGLLQVMSNGLFKVNGALTATDVKLQTLSGGSLEIAANITASNSLTLNANAAGNLTVDTVALSTPSLTLITGTDSIGAQNTPFVTSATTLAITTGGSAFMQDTNSVTLNASSAKGTLSVTDSKSNGTLTVVGALTAANINLQSTTSSDGNIALNSNITATAKVTIQADGAGAVTQGLLCFTKAASVAISSASGDLGTSLQSLETLTPSISLNTPVGNVYAVNIGTTSLQSSTAGLTNESFNFKNQGALTIAGPVTALLVNIGTIGGNFNMVINKAIVANGAVSLIAGGTGSITQLATLPVAVTGTSLAISGSGGSFGGTTAASALKTQVGSLSAVTTGTKSTINISNTGSVSLVSSGLNSLSAGGAVTLLDNGTITVSGAVTGSTILLQTATNSAGNIIVGAAVGTANTTTALTLKTDGLGTITQLAAGQLLVGSTLTLTTGGGNIGANNLNLGTVAATMTATAGTATGSGNVYIANSGNLKLNASIAGSSFNISDNNSLTAAGAITSSSITLATSANNGTITLGANVGKSAAVVSLTANGSGNIYQTAGTITGSSLSLNSTTGNIGKSTQLIKTAISGNSNTIASNTGGTGSTFISNTNSGTTNLASSTSGGAYSFTTTGALSVNGLTTNVNSLSTIQGSISLTATSGKLMVNSGSAITAMNGNLTLLDKTATNATAQPLIEIGSNATLSASSATTGLGNVYIVMGSVPTTPVNQSQQTNIISSGNVFFGTKGITGFAPTNTVIATGNKIIFSTGTLPTTTIQLDGGAPGVRITSSNLFGPGNGQSNPPIAYEHVIDNVDNEHIVDTGDCDTDSATNEELTSNLK